MTTALLIATLVLLLAVIALLCVLLRRQPPSPLTFDARLQAIEQAQERLERSARDESSRVREDAALHARSLREELGGALKAGLDSLLKGSTEAATQQASKLDAFAGQLARINEVSQDNGKLLRDDVTKSVQGFADAATGRIKEAAGSQKERLEEFANRLGTFLEVVTKRLDEIATTLENRLQANQKAQAEALVSLRETLHKQLREMQDDNGKQIAQMRSDAADGAKRSREEITQALDGFKTSVMEQVTAASLAQKNQLETFATQLGAATTATEQKLGEVRETVEKRLSLLHDGNDKKLGEMRDEARTAAQAARQEITTALKQFEESVLKRLENHATTQKTLSDGFQTQITKLTESNARRFEELRGVVDQKLKELREENGQKLDQMRQTVDEKLEGTLEKRLGESFKLVSDRLEQVHKGLGEMQTLASGVGDLKRVLSNVKARGTWAEVQLGALLEQTLALDQYAKNVATKPDSNERVEFAIKLPGRDANMETPVWLPLDAKCPQEDYLRLMEASERGDPDGVREAAKQLEQRVRGCAKDIHDKYLAPPHTTDFGILFLPTEGLYAEVLRCPGLTETLQRECRVIVAGPTTLLAILNSLQMGFRTLAIEKRSSEVWAVLGAVKTEFGKFGTVFKKVKKKLSEATKTVDAAAVRTRAMERRLRTVDELPAPMAADLLGLQAAVVEDCAESATTVQALDGQPQGTSDGGNG